MIPVTKPYLPDRARLDAYIDRIYDKCWLTNNGPLVQELTERLKEYLGVENLLLVTNGTLALQIAYRALDVKGTALTTPFSFVATTSTLVWEGITPKFVDIDAETLCMDPDLIEEAITDDVTTIVPVHVFGNACEVERIDEIAKRHNLKVIYDAAHAFGVRYKGESLLNYGDASTLSFHATKLFHTIEGGAIVFKEKEALERAKLLINFGIDGPDSIATLGINAKMNEFQAAMGLAVLDELEENIKKRESIWNCYAESFSNLQNRQKINPYGSQNYSYFPILLENEITTINIIKVLSTKKIYPRRYFYPTLDCIFKNKRPNVQIAINISQRILCLPLYSEMKINELNSVINTIKETLNEAI